MKSKLVIWLLVSLMVLGSCGRDPGDAVSDSESESSEVNTMDELETDTEDSKQDLEDQVEVDASEEDQTEEVETDPEVSVDGEGIYNTETEDQDSEIEETENKKPQGTTSEDKKPQKEESNTESSEEKIPEEDKAKDEPEQDEPAKEEPPKEEPKEEESSEENPKESETEEVAFDIDYWVSFAQEYATQRGLILDEGTTGCWDTPIIASPRSIYLERNIKSRIDFYVDVEGCTHVWIWYEEDGENSYRFFVGYA